MAAASRPGHRARAVLVTRPKGTLMFLDERVFKQGGLNTHALGSCRHKQLNASIKRQQRTSYEYNLAKQAAIGNQTLLSLRCYGHGARAE